MLSNKGMKYLIPLHKHPRRNLPTNSSKRRTEADFVLAFGRAYYQGYMEKQIDREMSIEMAREMYVHGLGIADIVSVFISSQRVVLHAFEMKIKDWRKALSQAYRYKYYANSAYVVLPPDEAAKAKQSLMVFRAINVGLWAFDKEKNCIKKIYNPKKDNPISNSAYRKALAHLSQKFKFLPVS